MVWGGYEEDIEYGVRVIDLVSMLAQVDLSATDLRRTDLSEANLVNTQLKHCDLSRTNLSRTILYGADLMGAELTLARFCYGNIETATPRDRINPPNYTTGDRTGAVIENANLESRRRPITRAALLLLRLGRQQNPVYHPRWLR